MPGPLTRRRLVSGTVAGAALTALAPPRLAAGEPTPDVSLYLGPALEPELVTVTDTAFAAWWWTAEPADTTVRLTPLEGPDAGRTRTLRLEERTQVHVARVGDLTPGRRYGYELWSGGRRVSLGSSAADPGTFRTLQPPPGRRLATIALLNDLHVGERCSGTVTDALGPSLPPCYSADTYPDYAHRMLDAAIGELHDLPIDLVVANGDLSHGGGEEDVRRALAQLRRLQRPLLVTRGNHDKRQAAGTCAVDGDCLREQAFPEQPAGSSTLLSVERVGDRVAVVGLDSWDARTRQPSLLHGDQPAWLDRQLAVLRGEGRDVVVAFHHPLLVAGQGVAADQGADAVLAVLARHPHVRLVVHGHTHANALQFHGPTGRRVPFLQNGATKEYPAGYALLHVHEDGIVRTFHRPVTAWTRTWTATSARQVWGLHPSITRGSIETRAFVHRYAGQPIASAAVPAARAEASPPAVSAVRSTTTGRLARGLAVGIHVPRRARVTVRLRAELPRADGRRRTVVLARATRRSAPGTIELTLRPGRGARRALARLPRATSATIEVVLAPPGGRAVTLRRRILLRPR
ncbi:metallophosphoesterase [Patulibacter brassicae]|uniref:Metallophosphoesterase n=1 Tax=Patulibacter brassicae TaxID=1705717 RepID=A0ABU4VGS2_9ACTN|nr:metallophosphoesterase [Patulibacter brassicae]MDX8150572.1 metallophosphoesterase [Patulibacter brassicae]